MEIIEGLKFKLSPKVLKGRTYNTVFTISKIVQNRVFITWEGKHDNSTEYHLCIVKDNFEDGTWIENIKSQRRKKLDKIYK